MVVQGQLVNGSGGTLVYRWPGSFLRITVEVDENREEGPLCIEYSSRQPVPLSDGRHPVLGAVFKRRPAE